MSTTERRPGWALARGAGVGFAVLMVVDLIIYRLLLPAVGEGVIPSPVAVAVILLPRLAPGLAAGVTAHFLLLKTGRQVPRLTWLVLTAFFLPISFVSAFPAAIVGGTFYALMAFLSETVAPWFASNQAAVWAQVIVQIVQAIITFGLWFLLGNLALRDVDAPAGEDNARASRAWPLISAQLALALFVAASWGPGMGTLMVGAAIGLTGMVVLAVIATVRGGQNGRTPAFLLGAWSTPLATLVAVMAVIALEASVLL